MNTTIDRQTETIGTLRIERGTDPEGRPVAIIWRGRAIRPFVRYWFHSTDQREAYIAQQVAADARRADARRERKSENAKRTENMMNKMPVGTILVSSWGCEQTNIDFYQVIERRGRVAIIRPIRRESVPGSEGFMCDQVKPVRDGWVGDAFRKMIGPYGLKIGHAAAVPVEGDRSYYRSWYA